MVVNILDANIKKALAGIQWSWTDISFFQNAPVAVPV